MAPSETLSTSPATFGKKSRSTDWFEAYSSELAPVTEEEQTALTEYKCRPSRETLQSFRSARSNVRKAAKRHSNNYWLQLYAGSQSSADAGNIWGMYSSINKAYGLTQNKTAPLKSFRGETILDEAKQMQRLVQTSLISSPGEVKSLSLLWKPSSASLWWRSWTQNPW